MQYRIIITLFFLVFGISLNAQVTDRDKKTIRIPAAESKKEKDSSPVKIKVAPKKALEKDKGTSNKTNKTSKKNPTEVEKPFSMVEDDGLRSPGEIFAERWRKEAQASGIVKFMSDQFLGEYPIDSQFVNIVCRDHEYPDGDRVSVAVNDEIVYRNVTLQSQYRRLKINLIEGVNRIDITALNQGDSGPNTAEFVVYDDKGNVVSSKEWNLLTGVKATIVFINSKPKITTAKNDGN
ncbi:MAG: hypothetical protein ED556_07980 [Winogradskyella sp.]|uniref:hypothetical protein n=1 Tax=Winogradskyella sp. TaxID=1883156 RepID=UPI000F3F3C43|nr:hypothetical protein [Winogradskyella sp.]RNC86228.1 MAG: hypothetical protein ED556_07980 [Winogradskyella sp.]